MLGISCSPGRAMGAVQLVRLMAYQAGPPMTFMVVSPGVGTLNAVPSIRPLCPPAICCLRASHSKLMMWFISTARGSTGREPSG